MEKSKNNTVYLTSEALEYQITTLDIRDFINREGIQFDDSVSSFSDFNTKYHNSGIFSIDVNLVGPKYLCDYAFQDTGGDSYKKYFTNKEKMGFKVDLHMNLPRTTGVVMYLFDKNLKENIDHQL